MRGRESHWIPVLENKASLSLEEKQLKGTDSVYAAMQSVGEKIANELLNDFQELKPIPENLSVLALVGKGKNGGDCLLTCDHLMRTLPRAKVVVFLFSAIEQLHPLTQKALQELEGRVRLYTLGEIEEVAHILSKLDSIAVKSGSIHLCIDGVYGLGFKPPLSASMRQVFEGINTYDKIEMRASIDIPSGLYGVKAESECYFRANFSYMAGTAKSIFFQEHCDAGRIRFIDIGLYDGYSLDENSNTFYLSDSYLHKLAKLRASKVDKRSFGHVFILGGSRWMPGALLMTVQAAIRSGSGLVTVFAPRSIVPALCGQAPEAMWIPLPESNAGLISQEAGDFILSQIRYASSLVVGPGLGKSHEIERVLQQLIRGSKVPIVLDADALVPRVLESFQKRNSDKSRSIIITPHMGEFLHVTKLSSVDLSANKVLSLVKNMGVTMVLKGPITRICNEEHLIYSTRGGPVLSRGGSGDLLAGIIGVQLAQEGADALSAATLGVLIHGKAAELLARTSGQVFVRTTDVLDFLPKVIR